MDNRYSRQLQLPGFGPEAQQKLQEARVLVVGAGGLGVPVLQYLAGMGVGTLGIVDGDTISLTNLHRQVLYSTNEVGQLKVEVAVQKLAALNPEIRLLPYPTHLTPQNALVILESYDLVIDATDNFSARYLINDACVQLHKPFVYGALHQFEGQVSVFNFQGGPTYRCLYPTPPSAQEIPDCNTGGVLGVVPGLIGLQQALEAVKVLTGIGKSLSGYLLVRDYLNQSQYKIKLKARPENQKITSLQGSYEVDSCFKVPEVSAEELYGWVQEGRKMLLLDVREQEEYVTGHLQKALLTPLSVLKNQLEHLPQHLPIVTICQKGSRSQKAAQLLLEQDGKAEVYSLTGGMEAWHTHLPNKLVAK
ncbi:HesA/MoeB/ThiF family protein [Rufibacter latericius]|uniref:Molybdopterin-synthase adenylyltransferase n=1 Tax=Rufibacter latericius TaxID=2487040 RepID=A0A3M9N0Q6_9BACT|nr:HesA/MoeB/ThiF family protein [Rufibacter latericius]RNI30588.1 sulfurtransferase [Rufibacter latericius]